VGPSVGLAAVAKRKNPVTCRKSNSGHPTMSKSKSELVLHLSVKVLFSKPFLTSVHG
jgi:hypothetical protein